MRQRAQLATLNVDERALLRKIRHLPNAGECAMQRNIFLQSMRAIECRHSDSVEQNIEMIFCANDGGASMALMYPDACRAATRVTA
jgi:hypothetical protein